MKINPQAIYTIALFLKTFLASILAWILFLSLGYLWLVAKKVKKNVIIIAFVSALNSWAIASLVKYLIPSIRPFELGLGELYTATVHFDPSFPSAHSAVMFSLATALYLGNRGVGLVYFAGAILVAYGRVISNAHFTIDAVAGAALGIFMGILVDSVASRSIGRKKKKVENH